MIYRLSSFLVKAIKQNPSNQKWPQQRTSKRSTKTAQTLITGNHVVRSTQVKMSKSRLFICKLIFVPRRLKKGRIVPLYSNSPFSAHTRKGKEKAKLIHQVLLKQPFKVNMKYKLKGTFVSFALSEIFSICSSAFEIASSTALTCVKKKIITQNLTPTLIFLDT